MSLRDAVEDVVKDMEAEQHDVPRLAVYCYALKKALRASEGEPGEGTVPIVLPPEVQNAIEIQKAREAIREARMKSSFEESRDVRMVEVVGGPHGGSDGPPAYHAVSPGMPDGARTLVGDQVYALRGGKLVWDPPGQK